MSDEHGGACCEECAMGRACAGDSCGLSKLPSTTVRGALRVPSGFMITPAGQVFDFGDQKDQYRVGTGDSVAEAAQAARLLAGTNLTCETYLALTQARRQNAIALRYYGMRLHTGERPFNSFHSAMDALNESERQQAIRDVLWLNQHCVAVEARRIQRARIASQVTLGSPNYVGAKLTADAAAANQPNPYAGDGGSTNVASPYAGGSITPAKVQDFWAPAGQVFAGPPYGYIPKGYIGSSLAPRFDNVVHPWGASYGMYEWVAPGGQVYSGTLTIEQRARMYNALTPTERTQYDAMSPTDKTAFEARYATAHPEILSTTYTYTGGQPNQAYLSATERALGLTFGAITTAMANNNQQRLAEIAAANARVIAEINAQLQRDLAPTEATRLRNELANAQYTQQVLDRERARTSRMWMYVAGGVAVVLVGGGVVYAVTHKRTNPVIGGRDNKHGRWVQPKRKSSSRRRRSRARA